MPKYSPSKGAEARAIQRHDGSLIASLILFMLLDPAEADEARSLAQRLAVTVSHLEGLRSRKRAPSSFLLMLRVAVDHKKTYDSMEDNIVYAPPFRVLAIFFILFLSELSSGNGDWRGTVMSIGSSPLQLPWRQAYIWTLPNCPAIQIVFQTCRSVCGIITRPCALLELSSHGKQESQVDTG